MQIMNWLVGMVGQNHINVDLAGMTMPEISILLPENASLCGLMLVDQNMVLYLI